MGVKHALFILSLDRNANLDGDRCCRLSRDLDRSLLHSTFFVVKQQTAAVIQRFGKFARVAHPGLNIKIPLIEDISGHVSLRVHQLEVKVETKTEDNVFVHLTVSVQYLVKAR